MTPADEARRKLTAAPADWRLAVLFAPAEQRAVLTALFALYLELCEIPAECSDRGVAFTKLGWWQEEIEALCAGQPRHPLTQALLPLRDKLQNHRAAFLSLLAGIEADITGSAYGSFEDLRRQCLTHGGALAELTAVLFGADSESSVHAARLLGTAYHLAEIIITGPAEALHGRILFAADDLRAHGLDRHIHGAPGSEAGLAILLRDYAERARSMRAEALTSVRMAERTALAAWEILSALALKRVDKLARRSFAADGEPLELRPLAALLTAWSAARHAVRSSTS